MAWYRVSFEGKWQGDFEDRNAALEWARAVGDTGRLTHVARISWCWTHLEAIFPEDRYDEGKRLWSRRMAGSGGGG